MKSVLVVGAGPAGLVAAKTLLQHGGGSKFKVTIFEAAERVGGMWRARKDEKGDKCSPHMRTNLSRFTVAFPDMSWTSVDLSDMETANNSSKALPMFPNAWQVGRYLETYADKFIPTNAIHLNRRVTGADFINEKGIWKITSYDKTSNKSLEHVFDHLIVASGFFGQPAHRLKKPSPKSPQDSTNLQHSSEFRSVSSLVDKQGNIAVIGGGISGSEAAATAAFQISSAKHSPGNQKPTWADSKVYHIFNRPFYALPRYLPQDPYSPAIQDFNLSPKFLPLDLAMYNLSRRGGDIITASNGPVPPEKAKKAHEYIRSILGGDQRDLGRPELVYKPDHTQYPAFTGIAETYAEFVRSGLIVPVQGWAESITATPSGYSIDITPQAPWADGRPHVQSQTVSEISGVIEATGFTVHIDYLSDSIKSALKFDSDCPRVPFILSRGSIFCAEIPTLAFVGFYEGPYWGVMEMQARLIAQRWTPLEGRAATAASLNDSEAYIVRDSLKKRSLDIPQFWMSDYVGLIEEFSRHAGIVRDDSIFDGQTGPVFPARYHGQANDEEALVAITQVSENLEKSTKSAKFVAAAAFRAMQGKWTLHRKIDSRHASMPGGTLKGTAHFHPRAPTDSHYAAEYLYIEEGTLTMDNGLSFPATRRYIYRYNESTDVITAWFVDEDGESTSNLFNTWEFYHPDDTYHGWLAKGHHWCSPDTYKSNCEFRFRGASLESFGITYDVSGPKKDYAHESWYRRAT